MSIGTGVIIAIAFEQVDGTPDAETGAERHNESLQYTDCAVEKCHTGLLKKFPIRGGIGLSDASGSSPCPSSHLPLLAVGA